MPLIEKSQDEIRQILNLPSEEERAERSRRYDAGKKLIGQTIDQWPPCDFSWDYSNSSQRFAFDGMSLQDFDKYYPNGLCLASTELKDLDAALCAFNKRTPEEVWGVGDDRKAAGVLLDCIEKRPITPPCIGPTNQTNELCLNGGNHRLAVARAKGETHIPILYDPEHEAFIRESLTLLEI